MGFTGSGRAVAIGVLLLSCSAMPVAAQNLEPVAENVSPIDPQAAEIVLASARYLEKSKAFSVRWSASTDEIVDGREKVTRFQSGSGTIARGLGFAAFVDRGTSLRRYYFDGAQFSIVSPDQGFYASTPFEGRFDDLVQAVKDNTGTILPVWVLFSETLTTSLVSGIQSAAYLGLSRVDGVMAHHVAMSSYDEDIQLWISEDPSKPVPLKIIVTQADEQGWPQVRVDLSDWNFQPRIEASSFQFQAEDDLVRIAIGQLSRPKDDGANGQ